MTPAASIFVADAVVRRDLVVGAEGLGSVSECLQGAAPVPRSVGPGGVVVGAEIVDLVL
jgi:hypothetical protein